MKTFIDYLEIRDNNFNLVRFIAASLVIFSHSYPLTLGPGVPDLFATFFGISTGTLAVNIFFAVSGFLVSKSFHDRNNLVTFLYARCLRIFPALIVAVLFCVLIIGALFTQLSLREYFSHEQTYTYLIGNISLVFFSLQYDLPGVFTHSIYPNAVNGSLWTLPIEVWMYFVVAVIGVVGILHKQSLFNLLLVLLVIPLYIYIFYYYLEMSEIDLINLRLCGFFLAGTFCYVNRKEIPLNGFILLGIAALTIMFRFWQMAFVELLFNTLTVYATFWFSLVPAGSIRRFNDIGDFSYGLYIYAFPIQQAIAALYIGIQPLEMMVVSFVMTLFCAYLSWNLVEKPALSLKY